jgi:hypothetical protein
LATQRYISTSFWDDAWIQELDPSEKLLYLYLMTNPLTNIAGVYKITVRRIVFDTGFNKDTVERILERFENDKKVFLYNEFVIIPTWPKHQRWDQRTKIRDGIISVLQDVPKEVINFANEIGYDFDLKLVDSTIIARKERVGISGSKRKKKIEAVNGKCEKCGSDNNVELHHKVSIKNGGDNSDGNLIVLCSECHKKIHSPHTVCGVHNYSDTDTDTDTDIDSDTDNSAEARADKQLFTAIEDSFLSQLHDDTQYNYGKERKHIKNIIERIHNKDSPEEFIKKVIETFHRLKNGRDKFWSKQPFLPSVLNSGGIWPRVVEEMQDNYIDTGVELWS